MKSFFKVLAIVVVLFSCSNPELDAAKKKQKEGECLLALKRNILDNGTNVIALAQKIGLEKELNEFNKLQSDSTISCDSLRNSWNRFSDLVYEKSK